MYLPRATFGKIVQNLLWASGYKVAAIPMAAAGLLHSMIPFSTARRRLINALPDPRPQESHEDHGSPDGSRGSSSGGLHAWMMPLCLILMGGAFAFVLWRGQTGGSLLLLLPMLLCLGIHFLMHRHGHGQRYHDE